MDLDKDIQNPPSEVPCTFLIVDPITYAVRLVPNQNVSNSISTGIDQLQYQDISASNIQYEYELQPAMETSANFNASSAENMPQQSNIIERSIDITNVASTISSNTQQYPYAATTFNSENSACSASPSESFPALVITKQPKKMYRFRFQSEIEKDSHGYLCGVDDAGRNCRTYTTVELRVPTSMIGQYHVRCTLHQPSVSGSEEQSFISPHTLCRRNSDSTFTCEDELFPMVEVMGCNSQRYQFKLENFLIIRPKQNQTERYYAAKYKMLYQKHGSKLRIHSSAPNKEEMVLKQVQIGFEIFKLMPDNSFIQYMGPIFSHCITDGEPLKIARICNLHGDINGTEVTLLVSGYKSKMKTSIEMNDNLGWTYSKEVDKKMLHSNAAVTFQTPKYNNVHNKNAKKIKCEIRLKRLIDNELSNMKTFTYTRTLKRSHESNEQDENEMTQTKVQRPQMSWTNESNFSFGNEDEYQKNSVAEVKSNVDLCGSETVSIGVVDEDLQEETSKELVETLKHICHLDTKAGKGIDHVNAQQLIRQWWKYYEQESPHNNSILHEILENDKYQDYATKLYTIITQHFDLKDLIRDSRNIYDETVLMYACMFNKPVLIRAFIRMECPVQAQSLRDGNNILHLIAQPLQNAECRTKVMDAIKSSKNKTIIDGALEALGDYNLRGLTPLHVAVMHNNVALVTEFLRFSRKHNALDFIGYGKLSDGNTILHIAVLNKSPEMYKCILKYVPNYEMFTLQNNNGDTPEEIIKIMEKPLFEHLVGAMASMKLNVQSNQKLIKNI